MSRKKIIIIVTVVIAILLLSGATWLLLNRDKSQGAPATSEETKPQEQKTTPAPTPDPQPSTPMAPTWPVQLAMAEAASLTVDVNKKHKLPDNYVPAGLTAYGGVQLRAEVVPALTDLFNAAGANGFGLMVISGYRSFASQKAVYNSYVAQDGQAKADTYSARPGFSEHQTGLALDVGNGTCDLEICFGNTATGIWIAENAHNYGFIVRYPNGKEADTGYQYEPWHLRYLGKESAQAIYASGKTMDQYYNIAAGGYE